MSQKVWTRRTGAGVEALRVKADEATELIPINSPPEDVSLTHLTTHYPLNL